MPDEFFYHYAICERYIGRNELQLSYNCLCVIINRSYIDKRIALYPSQQIWRLRPKMHWMRRVAALYARFVELMLRQSAVAAVAARGESRRKRGKGLIMTRQAKPNIFN